MTHWYADKIATNGLHLYYTRTGGDKPPVVLAHGFSDDGLCWTPVAQKLEENYDVIMVDARGHGRSDAKLRLNLNALNRTGAGDMDWPQTLRSITCPALLLTADTDLGAMVTTERAAEMQALVPQLQVTHIPGAGHNIRREQFALFMEAVQTFLAQEYKGS